MNLTFQPCTLLVLGLSLGLLVPLLFSLCCLSLTLPSSCDLVKLDSNRRLWLFFPSFLQHLRQTPLFSSTTPDVFIFIHLVRIPGLNSLMEPSCWVDSLKLCMDHGSFVSGGFGHPPHLTPKSRVLLLGRFFLLPAPTISAHLLGNCLLSGLWSLLRSLGHSPHGHLSTKTLNSSASAEALLFPKASSSSPTSLCSPLPALTTCVSSFSV